MGDDEFGIEEKQGNCYLFMVAINDYSQFQPKHGQTKPMPLYNAVGSSIHILYELTKYYTYQPPHHFPEFTEIDIPDVRKYLAEKYIHTDIDPTRFDDPAYKNEIQPKLQTYTLFDEQATVANFEQHLDFLFGINGKPFLEKEDSLLLYITCHGLFNPNTSALNLMLYDQSYLASQLIDIFEPKFINGKFKEKIKDVLLVMDCCNARGISLSQTGIGDSHLTRRFIASSSHDGKAIDRRGTEKITPFAQSFLSALGQYNNTDDESLFQNIKEKLKDLDISNEQQTATNGYIPCSSIGGDFFSLNLKNNFSPPKKLKKHLKELNYTVEKSEVELKESENKNIDRLLFFTCYGDSWGTHNFVYKLLLDTYKFELEGFYEGTRMKGKFKRIVIPLGDYSGSIGIVPLPFNTKIRGQLHFSKEVSDEKVFENIYGKLLEHNVVLFCDFDKSSLEYYERQIKEIKTFMDGFSTFVHTKDNTLTDTVFVLFVRFQAIKTPVGGIDLFDEDHFSNFKELELGEGKYNYLSISPIGEIERSDLRVWGRKIGFSDTYGQELGVNSLFTKSQTLENTVGILVEILKYDDDAQMELNDLVFEI